MVIILIVGNLKLCLHLKNVKVSSNILSENLKPFDSTFGVSNTEAKS
jgi:hypothetical protein